MFKIILRYIVPSLLISACLSASTPILWGGKESPFVRKVMVALEYKGIPYELKEVPPLKGMQAMNMPVPDGFKKASPLGKIPAWQDGDFSIADSSVIVAYLEKKSPDHSLYPNDPKQYAEALWLEEYSDSSIEEVINRKILLEGVVKPKVFKIPFDQAVVANAINNELPVILEYLESWLKSHGGRYLVGDNLSIADLAVANHFVSLKLTDVKIDGNKWPLLMAYLERVYSEPSFKKVMNRLLNPS